MTDDGRFGEAVAITYDESADATLRVGRPLLCHRLLHGSAATDVTRMAAWMPVTIGPDDPYPV